MRLALVVAAARNHVIGHRGELPWRLPDDLRAFKALTRGHCVVMGRRTFESIGRALPERTNLVLSRRGLPEPGAPSLSGTPTLEAAAPDGARGGTAAAVRTFGDLPDALDWARGAGFEHCFVIGGEAVYREALDRADRIHLTRVEAEPEGDVFFPAPDPARWRCVGREARPADARHAHRFAFETWERIVEDPPIARL